MADKRKSKQLSNAVQIEQMKQFMVFLQQQTDLRFNAITTYLKDTNQVDVFQIYNDKLAAQQEAAKLAASTQEETT